ncbi:hypothetical protein O185_23580 [Photorhabdus temperata J3]|uniref:H repeat-associated protein N-terminal domain-containing protein n=1 Tax=Photorhabdus temperata J3 TaxID=1389415 RepID=U7QW57_PHOTE|nr:hypothetical protein O185_23580 [Photorhabdus temperata J3]
MCAVIAGAEGWEDIEDFGKMRLDWLQQKGLFQTGLPVHDTMNGAALPFTGDYDMHDMISFTTQPHSIPSYSLEEKKIINHINKYIDKYDSNRPFKDLEHNVIRQVLK